MKKLSTVLALAGIAGALLTGSATAQDFKGKTVTVYIPVGAGGGYDAYGRMVAGNIGRYLPGNPTVIATNMPGGGRKLGNFLYNAAPKERSATRSSRLHAANIRQVRSRSSPVKSVR